MKNLELDGLKKYVGGNKYAGTLNTYNYLIKYDNQSSVYNIYFNLKEQEKDKDIIKELKKEFKDSSVIFSHSTLVITGTYESIKDSTEEINNILNKTTSLIKENNYKEICSCCKKEAKVYLIDNEGEVNYYCNDCYKEFIKEAEYKKNNSNKQKENTIMGIIGSILCTIPGIICWIILRYLNIEVGLAAIFITMGSALGYKHFAKTMKIKGVIISSIIGLLMILFAHELSCSIYIYNLYKQNFNITLLDAYKSIPYYMNTVADFKKQFIKELSSGYLLSLIGIFSSYSLHRQSIYTYNIKKIGE